MKGVIKMYIFVLAEGEYVSNSLNRIKKYAKENNVITLLQVMDIYATDLERTGNEDQYGWYYNDIKDLTIEVSEQKQHRVQIAFPDPIKLKDFDPKIHKPMFDSIRRPSHYTEGCKYEPRKVIADWGLNFNLGNAVKYLARAGRKGDKVEDLRKAIQYIEFELEESK